jgi:hypothetical protein
LRRRINTSTLKTAQEKPLQLRNKYATVCLRKFSSYIGGVYSILHKLGSVVPIEILCTVLEFLYSISTSVLSIGTHTHTHTQRQYTQYIKNAVAKMNTTVSFPSPFSTCKISGAPKVPWGNTIYSIYIIQELCTVRVLNGMPIWRQPRKDPLKIPMLSL